MPEILPGATLRKITQEYEVVEDIKRVFRDRLELDKKYAADLRRIRDSINPKYQDTSIAAFVQPLINFFDEEIQIRESKLTSISSRLVLSLDSSPNEPCKNGIVPSNLYDALDSPYRTSEEFRQKAGSPQSVISQQIWYQSNRAILELSPWTGNFRLPYDDREYRITVSEQHEAASNALNFHSDNLPRRLEQHQDALESFQSLASTIITELSHLSSSVVQFCSTALNSTRNFSPYISCIAPHFEAVEKETSNYLLQPVRYHNFWLGIRESAPPIIGTNGEKESRLTGYLLDRITFTDWWQKRSTSLLETLTSFEYNCSSNPDLAQVAEGLSGPDRCGILALSLVNRPPLLHIDDKAISQYSSGVPRKRIAGFIPQGGHNLQTLQKLAFHPEIPPWIMVTLLTHRTDAANIVTDILSKWDFKRACPYPEGVARKMDLARNGLSEPVWKKNGRPFEPPERVDLKPMLM